MKIQFDTALKTIKVEGTVDMGELINALEKFLPNGVWREYKLETNTVIYWQQPYIYRWNEYPHWGTPWITSNGTSNGTINASGITTVTTQ